MTDVLRITALDSVMDLTVEAPAKSGFPHAVARAWSRCTAAAPTAAPTAASAAASAAASTAPTSATATPLTVSAPDPATEEATHLTLQLLTQEITRRLVESQTGRLLMFHAGAVSHPTTGASLVFVAPGGTGKTTLARLLGATYGYVTDETVGIDRSGRIHPYPKPLSLRAVPRQAKRETSPDDLGLLHAHPAATAARIVLLSRQPQHEGTPRVEELGTLDAITALIPETSAVHRLPQPLHALADLLARTGPVLRLHYREAEDLLPLAADLIGAP